MGLFSGKNVSVYISTGGDVYVDFIASSFEIESFVYGEKHLSRLQNSRLSLRFMSIEADLFIAKHMNIVRLKGNLFPDRIDNFSTVAIFSGGDDLFGDAVFMEFNLKAEVFAILISNVNVYCQSGGAKSFSGSFDFLEMLSAIAEEGRNAVEIFVSKERTSFSSATAQIRFNYEQAYDRLEQKS